MNGEFPTELSEWIKFYGISTKTAAVLLQLVYGKVTTVPVDLHVKVFCSKLGLTNTTGEISWQLTEILPAQEYIKFNDAIGPVPQKLADNKERPRFLDEVKKIAKQHGDLSLYDFIQLLHTPRSVAATVYLFRVS